MKVHISPEEMAHGTPFRVISHSIRENTVLTNFVYRVSEKKNVYFKDNSDVLQWSQSSFHSEKNGVTNAVYIFSVSPW